MSAFLQPETPRAAAQHNALTLAYLGDGVYELMVRRYLLSRCDQSNTMLHKRAQMFVSAARQSEFAEVLLPSFTPEELAVFNRGRNCPTPPNKRGDPAVQNRATALETLFGYLYLSGQEERMQELFSRICELAKEPSDPK